MADTIRWLTTQEAADRACCGPGTLGRAVRHGGSCKRLGCSFARPTCYTVGGELRFLASWIDDWLISQVMPEDADIAIAIDAAPSERAAVAPGS